MKKNLIKGLLLALILNPTFALAAPAKPVAPDELSNPYMLLMFTLMFVLLLVIVTLNHTIKTVASYKTQATKGNSSISKGAMTLALLLFSTYGFSQEAASATTDAATIESGDWTLFGMTYTTFFALFFGILFEIIVILFQLMILRGFIGGGRQPKPAMAQTAIPTENWFWKKVNASVAIEEEETILFDHEYDGIKELDNNLPPWWKYGFYITIVFAFMYMIHFHIAKSGALQEEEYLTEVEEGKKQVAEYLKNAADNVDENTVEYLTDAADLSEGKGIYAANCVACHGALGEGKVGPNLADQYWVHGGSINDIFYSIKYGWPDKGMKSWKDDLTPKQVARVSSYIKSLKGTNPPNAIEPKGELYKE